MTVYHQQGHDSNNLIKDEKLRAYKGVIVSPVNYKPSQISSLIKDIGEDTESNLDSFILDPQLYLPRSSRGKLLSWDYFPQDYETRDADQKFWKQTFEKLKETCTKVPFTGICSPAIFPKDFSKKYYLDTIHMANNMLSEFKDESIDVYVTIIIDITKCNTIKYIQDRLNIITKYSGDNIYLLFYNGIDPKLQLKDSQQVLHCMQLIQELTANQYAILVGYTGIESILWKYAGAQACATGKFFNLRRFSTERFEEPTAGGGGPAPYFVSSKYLTYLRDADILRMVEEKLISIKGLDYNPFSAKILENIQSDDAWLAESWKFYLYWFLCIHTKISNDREATYKIIKKSKKLWDKVTAEEYVFNDTYNDGKWVHDWFAAIEKFND